MSKESLRFYLMNNAPLFTAETLRRLIESEIEPDEPQNQIRAFIAMREGKRLTKRSETKMKETINGTIRFEGSVTGSMKITWGSYSTTGGRDGGCLYVKLIAQSAAEITNDNPAYFAGKDERNAKRAEALKDDAGLNRLANALNAKMAAERELNRLFEYGSHFEPDQYKIQKVWHMAADAIQLGMWPRRQGS